MKSDYYAPYWVWRLTFVTGYLLLGYALAAPTRLSIYFFPKPGIDIVTDALLILVFTFAAFKWVKKKPGWLIIFIPLLAVGWLRLDFLFFSMSAWWSIVSYTLMILWALAFSAFWCHFSQYLTGRIHILLALIIGGLGFYWGMLEENFILSVVVACFLIAFLPFAGVNSQSNRRILSEPAVFILLPLFLFFTFYLDVPVFHPSQQKHHDKVVFSHQTRFQTLDVTEWKGNHWFYQDNINHYSSIDSWLYYEPFVHPVMQLAKGSRVLVIGGENGMLFNYLKQYKPASMDLLPIDGEYLEIASTNPLYTEQNGDVFNTSAINIIPSTPFRWLNKAKGAYDVIFIDIPDPIDVELNQYYTREFYGLVHEALSDQGLIITQSGSPYFATAAFQSIEKTIAAADFQVASFHNQVLSLGEWGWTMGSKSGLDLRLQLEKLSFADIETQWLNTEAMQMMLSFGKPYVDIDNVEINTIKNPVIYRLYNEGNYRLN